MKTEAVIPDISARSDKLKEMNSTSQVQLSERTHSGKYCYGKTPMETWLESKKLADEKMLDMLPVVSVAENSGAQAVG